MRSGQSKQKGSITAEQNRLMRTQGPSRPTNFLENTEIPSSVKRIESNRQIARSKTKVQFNIEDHMTESRIQQAKAGLQLLKKKSRNHDRPASIQRKSQKQDPYSRKSINNANEPSNIDIESYPAFQSKIPKQKSPNITGSKRPSEKQYSNSIQEAPIAPKKKDFMALLDEEMQKENKGMQPVPKIVYSKPANSDPSEYPDANSALIQCSRGCGRMFNEIAIQKHEKICEKVFQSKRKAFNSAAFRQVEEAGKQQQNPMLQTQMSSLKSGPPKKKVSKQVGKQVGKQGTKEKIPKWKLESLQFRAGLQSSSGNKLTKEEKVILEQNSGMVQCQYCMRKFNAKAGQRHIEFCETKSKQMPKMNVSIKRK